MGIIFELGDHSLEDAMASGEVAAASWHEPGLRIMREVAWALTFLHEKGHYHGRLHPRNVLLCANHKIKLTDYALRYGAASEASRNYHPPEPTGPEPYLGDEGSQRSMRSDDLQARRWAFMAPEVSEVGEVSDPPKPRGKGAKARAEAEAELRAIKRRADVWSFGCLINFLGTGEPPYDGATWNRVWLADSLAEAVGVRTAVREAASRGDAAPLLPLERLKPPCPSAIWVLASSCVKLEPSARPVISAIVVEIRRATKKGLGDEAEGQSHSAAAHHNTPALPGPAMLPPPTSSHIRAGAKGHSMHLPAAAHLPAPRRSVVEREEAKAERMQRYSGGPQEVKGKRASCVSASVGTVGWLGGGGGRVSVLHPEAPGPVSQAIADRDSVTDEFGIEHQPPSLPPVASHACPPPQPQPLLHSAPLPPRRPSQAHLPPRRPSQGQAAGKAAVPLLHAPGIGTFKHLVGLDAEEGAAAPHAARSEAAPRRGAMSPPTAQQGAGPSQDGHAAQSGRATQGGHATQSGKQSLKGGKARSAEEITHARRAAEVLSREGALAGGSGVDLLNDKEKKLRRRVAI